MLNHSDFSLYPFHPNVGVAIFFAGMFIVTGICTVYQYFAYRSWYFWACVLGALMELVGFLFRAVSAKDTHNIPAYIVNYCLIILAPAVLAASCYQTYGRILIWVVPEHERGIKQMWVPVRWLTPIFVCGDVLSFLIQLSGAAAVSAASTAANPDEKKIANGQRTVKLGLAVQLIVFGFFTILGIRFLLVSSRWVGELKDGKKWKHLNYAVNFSCFLILVRSCYRVVEFSTGSKSGVNVHEAYFWIFDALMMLLMLATFNYFHPGKYLPNVGFRQKTVSKKQADVENFQMRS